MMEAFNYNSFLGLVGDVSSLASSSGRRSLVKYQSSTINLLKMVNLVRQHRSLTHQFLFSREGVSQQIDDLDGEIVKFANEIASDRYIGNSIERIALRNKLHQLTSSYRQRSISTNLVAHGKVIRQLIYQIDSQILISLDKAHRLDLAGDYNDQWQTVMSGIEALTQYRLGIMSMNMGLKPALLSKQASLLYVKLEKVDAIYSEYHPDLNNCMTELSQYVAEKEPTMEYQDRLFALSSSISSALIDVYESVIEKTYLKALNTGHAA